MLHLHRFQHYKGGALLDFLPGLDTHELDRARHRRADAIFRATILAVVDQPLGDGESHGLGAEEDAHPSRSVDDHRLADCAAEIEADVVAMDRPHGDRDRT